MDCLDPASTTYISYILSPSGGNTSSTYLLSDNMPVMRWADYDPNDDELPILPANMFYSDFEYKTWLNNYLGPQKKTYSSRRAKKHALKVQARKS